MPVCRRINVSPIAEEKVEYIDFLDRELLEEAESKLSLVSIQEEISRIRTEIREVVCNLDDQYLLDDILGYARHLVRRYMHHEEIGSYEGLGVDYEVIEPEVGDVSEEELE